MRSRASAETLIVELKEKMARAFETNPGERSSKYERARYVHALKAISTFLGDIEARSYSEHFYRLALALDDLSRGAVDPLLRPVDTGGTKKTQCIMGLVCACKRFSRDLRAAQGRSHKKGSRSKRRDELPRDQGTSRTESYKSELYRNKNPQLV
jgi:hypothetical protein